MKDMQTMLKDQVQKQTQARQTTNQNQPLRLHTTTPGLKGQGIYANQRDTMGGSRNGYEDA